MDKPTYAELEAEVARLRANLEGVTHECLDFEDYLNQETKLVDEARQWARYYKQLYNQIHPEYILMKLSLLPDEPDI